MRCAFCNRRIRGGDWTEFRKPTGGIVRYHYAESGPHRNCDAASDYFHQRTGLRPFLFTDDAELLEGSGA